MGLEYRRELILVPSAGPSPGVVFFDDFSGGLHFTYTSFGGDDFFEIDPTVSLFGSHSLYMQPRTTGAAANDFMDANLKTHLTPTNIVTYSTIFKIANVTHVKILRWTLKRTDGDNLIDAIITFTPAIPKWEYKNSAGDPVLIPGADFDIRSDTWHRFSLSIDYGNLVYLSAYLDQTLLPLSGLSLFEDTTVVHTSLDLGFHISNVGANAVKMWVDSIGIRS